LVFVVTVVLAQAAGCGSPGTSADTKAANSANATDAKSSGAAAGSLLTAQSVLEKMAAAYKNAATYEDFGTLEFRQDPNREQAETRANFSVAFQRPNKLRIESFNGLVVCDGKQWRAKCRLLPEQAVLREAPAKLNMDVLHADFWLYSELSDGDQLASPPLQLLWENDPIPALVAGSQDVTLDEPARFGDNDCYRVRVTLPAGPEYLWIDQKSFALRRMIVPIATAPNVPGQNTAAPNTAAAGKPEGDAQANRVWLTIDFARARLGGDIDPAAFTQFEVPKEAKTTRVLVPIGPYELVGRNLPEFEFADLEGKRWSSRALAGKSAVIHFWSSDVTEADPMIPMIEQLRAKYKDNDKVVLVAVSLDHPDMPAKSIEDAAKQVKINVPLLRDNGTEARSRLKIIRAPTTLFIDAKGVLQDCIIGYLPVAAAAAPRKLERLLAGEDLAKQTQAEFQQQLREIEKTVDLQFSGEAQTATVQQAGPARMAARSEPAKLHLKTLWKCDAVRPAGNILVAPGADGVARIFVVADFRSVSELTADGKLIANYKPPIAKEEFFINLRTGAGRDGKRYFATFAPMEQRFHLFDEKFNYLRSYPSDALENRHSGLSDVELGDLDGDGVLKAYVGFAGTVGVKCVSLQGTSIWSCRTLFNIGNVVPGPVKPEGQSDLYCVNDFSSVALLDAKGRLRDAVRLIAEGSLRSLVHADLTGGGETWCGVMFMPDPQHTTGKFTALGMDSSGAVKWKYALPSGAEQAVEAIVVGRLLPGTARQWILPGSDGSIHILASDGTLVDRFNYGEQVYGVATVEIGGKPALLISSANGVEAMRVE
jgi:peroxiredoxin